MKLLARPLSQTAHRSAGQCCGADLEALVLSCGRVCNLYDGRVRGERLVSWWCRCGRAVRIRGVFLFDDVTDIGKCRT